MLVLSKNPSPENVLRLAGHLLAGGPDRQEAAYAMALLAAGETTHPEMLLRIARHFFAVWQPEKARTLLRTVDVDAAYAADPGLRDLRSQIAWMRFRERDMGFEKVLPFMELDLAQGRMSGVWQLLYAQALCVNGRDDEARRLVADAYAGDVTLQNGHVQCKCLVGPLIYEPREALPWFERDIALDRMHGVECGVYLAFVRAELGDLDAALDLAEKAYAASPTLRNALANLGWRHYAVVRGRPEAAWPLFERDQTLGRLTPNMQFTAGLFALTGNRTRAAEMVAAVNTAPGNPIGDYQLVAFCDYAATNDLSHLGAMLRRYRMQIGYCPPFFAYLDAAVCLRRGEEREAQALLRGAAERSALSGRFARYWLRRIPLLGEERVAAFLTPELEERFARLLDTVPGALAA